jgi:tRNA threonylcarbamoyladenosine biosynthesis protein TsaE
MTFQIRCTSVDVTHRVAAALEPLLRPGDVVVLAGELGGGKTTFVQGLARAMGITGRVTSPTFTLAQTYQGRLTLHHLDVYRLNSLHEVMDLDLPELMDDKGIVAIEWGELIAPELPRDYLLVRLSPGAAGDGPDVRVIEIEPRGASWSSRESAIAAALKPLQGAA